MAGFVLTDASPLIGLAQVGGLAWLPRLFGKVWVCQEVLSEVLPKRGRAGEGEIAAAIEAGALHLWQTPTPTAPPLPDLDEGESACIRIALAQPLPALLLIDERAGRALATDLGLRVAGTAAVIGLAKKQGLIARAKPCFETLHQSNFRIKAEVIRTVLRSVGE